MRLGLLKRLTFILFLLLSFCLAYNQIIKGPYYFQLSQNNRIRPIRLDAPRGLILDQNGKILAGRRVVFNVAILLQEAKDVQKVLNSLSPTLGISEERLLQQVKKGFFAPFVPVVIARDVPKETAIILECKESEIPGLVIQTEFLRDYRYAEGLCHILGYLGKISEDELKRFKVYGLEFRDLVGRGGVEERFEHSLRGQAGGMQIEVNSRNRLVKVLGSRQPLPGKDIYLTVDARLQTFINGLLEGKSGSCIVMDSQNGEIRALVSKPGFDPNLFIAAINEKPAALGKIDRLLNSQEALLLNRAISGTYPAGSIFKVVVAAAALETGKITPKMVFNCAGSLKVGNREFFCWNLDGHGDENIYSALYRSCNVFFYKLGLILGPDCISTFARKFGLGSNTEIDLPYESKGLVPSKAWKFKVEKERWYDGETANFSIGQGYLLVTPLQIAQMLSVVANGGYLVRPHIVKVIDRERLETSRKNLGFRKATLETIKEGMRQVIQDPAGTGHRAYIPGIVWAAKTGTAQNPSGAPHGWFGGFYPFDKPELTVVVFLEHAGSGGEASASIAKEIVEYIVENK